MSVVSIISANYNKAAFLEEMVSSVCDQTSADWELIIVDDCSTDGSADILRSLNHPRIKTVFNEENRGGNYSRNIGLKLATGTYVMFLDSDDLLVSDCIQQRIDFFKDNENADLCVFAMGVFRQKIGDQMKTSFWVPYASDYLKRFLSHDLPWAICQPLWKREFLLALGGFNEYFVRLQDVELHTRALINEANVVINTGAPDCYYRISEGRYTGDVEQFVKRHMEGSLQYFNHFKGEVSKVNYKYLHITLLEAISFLFHYRLQGKIKRKYYQAMTDDLIQQVTGFRFRLIIGFYVGVGKYSPFYVRGLKRFLSKLLTL